MRLLIGFVFAVLAVAADAHHSIVGRYDLTKQRVLHGSVSKYEWVFPHVYIFLDVAGPDGEADRWQILGLPPTMLQRHGWSRDSLTAGETVTITVFPPLDPDRRSAAIYRVLKLDGTELVNAPPTGEFLRHTGDSPPRTTSLSGTWFTEPGDLAVKFGMAGRPQVELTEAGNNAFESFDHDRENPGNDCVQLPAPFHMVVPTVMNIEIGNDVSIIRSEWEGVERKVHMKAPDHDSFDAVLPHGNSIGRWEGEVLVVETAHFSPHRVGTVAGVPSGPEKRLTERYALNPNGASLTYTFELSDPEYLAESMTGSMQWQYKPGIQYTPPSECDLENAHRFLKSMPRPK